MAGPSHTTIRVWLLVRLAAGLTATAAPLERAVSISLIVGIALAKAVLVGGR